MEQVVHPRRVRGLDDARVPGLEYLAPLLGPDLEGGLEAPVLPGHEAVYRSHLRVGLHCLQGHLHQLVEQALHLGPLRVQRDHEVGVAHQQPQALDPQDGVCPHNVLAGFVTRPRQGRSRREAPVCRHLREAVAVQGTEVLQRVRLGVAPERPRAAPPHTPLVEY